MTPFPVSPTGEKLGSQLLPLWEVPIAFCREGGINSKN